MPYPTKILCGMRDLRTPRFPVGAGLPAIAVGQAPSMSTVQSSSRASPLPQGILIRPEMCTIKSAKRRSSLGEAPNERGKSPWLLGAGRSCVFPSNPPQGRNPKSPSPKYRIYTPAKNAPHAPNEILARTKSAEYCRHVAMPCSESVSSPASADIE